MQPDQNGARPPVDGDRSSLYALVIYLPEPLCSFLDDLRLEMVPGCNPHAHVSVLPPRILSVQPEAAVREIETILAGFPPFEITLGGIEKFAATDVIYITVEDGAGQLRRMHARLNQSALAFNEPYEYHPHVTIAQEILPERVAALQDFAARRWRDFPGRRSFRAGSAVFVRNTRGNMWVDLAEEPLLAEPVR